MALKRNAKYVCTLVYMNEPLLIQLKSYKTPVLALAIPSADKQQAKFIATTVSAKDLSSYLEGHVDLRYLFTYPFNRSIYMFDLMTMKDNKVVMLPFEGPIPEELLPSPRFFATSHTHDYTDNAPPPAVETLVVDGEWDMPDFGEFYSRYSDVYYLLSASHAFTDENRSIESRKTIKRAFTNSPFKGGFSYVNFFSALPAAASRQERLRMDKIKYESPGYVNVHGDQDTFLETQALVRTFLANRAALRENYNRLHNYLSKNRYLKMAGENFLKDDPAAKFIDVQATKIAELLNLPNVDTIKSLVENNSLVFAKITLALYRRVKDAAQFFAEGRMNFT
jgi:hypothetical protein